MFPAGHLHQLKCPRLQRRRFRHDGTTVIVTTFDESKKLGYVELLNSSDMTDARVVEVPAEPFHALPEAGPPACGPVPPDNRHLLVALASGEITRIDLTTGTIVKGGFPAGGTMPEMLLYV